MVSSPPRPIIKKKKSVTLLSEIDWSTYQQALFTTAKESDQHLLVQAVAGSGKTTSLVGLVQHLDLTKRVTIVAFNKRIQQELQSKMPAAVNCKTAHSIGLSLVKLVLRKVDIDSNKKYNILRDEGYLDTVIGEFDNLGQKRLKKLRKQFPQLFVNAAGMLQLTLTDWVVPGKVRNTLEEQSTDLIKYLQELKASDSQIKLVCNLLGEMLDKSIQVAKSTGVIDFDDMIWLPNAWDISIPKGKEPGTLLIDEAQDMSAAITGLYKRYALAGSRIIAVGDRNQSINGFAGAMPDAMDIFAKDMNAQELPLSICYRCPTSHLDLARNFVQQIEPSPTAIKGEIIAVDFEDVLDKVKPGDLILSRKTAPLIDLCINIAIKGIPADLAGIDLASPLVNLLENHFIDDEAYSKFEETADDLVSKVDDQSMSNSAKASLLDSIYALQKCHKSLAADTGMDFNSFKFTLERLLNPKIRNHDGLRLSTIHRGKGTEADRTFILDADTLPWMVDGASDWQIQQEVNAAYVAVTRAKKVMHLVKSEDFDPNKGTGLFGLVD